MASSKHWIVVSGCDCISRRCTYCFTIALSVTRSWAQWKFLATNAIFMNSVTSRKQRPAANRFRVSVLRCVSHPHPPVQIQSPVIMRKFHIKTWKRMHGTYTELFDVLKIPHHPVSVWKLWNERQSYWICITGCETNYMPNWLNNQLDN